MNKQKDEKLDITYKVADCYTAMNDGELNEDYWRDSFGGLCIEADCKFDGKCVEFSLSIDDITEYLGDKAENVKDSYDGDEMDFIVDTFEKMKNDKEYMMKNFIDRKMAMFSKDDVKTEPNKTKGETR